jgi:plasmid stabilization system protein ParE
MGGRKKSVARTIPMSVKILPSAINDLADGRTFYEQQTPDVGDYFLDSLFSDIDSVALYGGIHRQISGYFVMLAKRFPYAIYYRMQGDNAIVWRVLDCRRDPRWIRTQLKND